MSGDERQDAVGLCIECGFHKTVVSAHETIFHYCTRSELDPWYPKYPRLPVLDCNGFERHDPLP